MPNGPRATALVEAEAAPAPARPATPAARFALAAGLVLVAFNLRPLFSSLAAVLPEMRAATGASASSRGSRRASPIGSGRNASSWR